VTKPGNIEVCSYFRRDNTFIVVKRKENLGCMNISEKAFGRKFALSKESSLVFIT